MNNFVYLILTNVPELSGVNNFVYLILTNVPDSKL